MHELSIASGIAELVESEAGKADAVKINAVEVEIGDLSGVEISALEFAWDAVISGTLLKEAELVIHRIEALAECADCGHTFQVKDHFSPCLSCGSFRQEIKQGKELRVRSIVVD